MAPNRTIPHRTAPHRMASHRAVLIALTALAPVSWGTTYAVTTEFLPADRPLFTGLARALPAGLLLLALARVLPRGAWWWKATVLGALNIGAFFPLLFLSAYRLPGGMAAAVGSIAPLCVAGLSAPLLGQRPTARTLLAGVVAACGVSLVVLKATGALDPLGVLAALTSIASMSTGTVLTQRWGRPEGVGPLALAGWQLTAGGLLIAPLALLAEGAPPALDGPAAGGYLYLALVNTAVAYWLWFHGIGRLTATQVTFLGPLSPLTAAVVGWAALGEALTPWQLVGMALAFGATVASQLAPAPRRKAFERRGEPGRRASRRRGATDGRPSAARCT
ncbi:probable blue pigment (indigoidine) exporter [Streptomyces prasinopilosus]|uniref:Probable blue pigment (Indigoidine) exporter n=2 Tax=Streptomyces prasinopilosus TaxID=67344 RepID=A0A1G6IPC4_9ACTN|nr:probable blue pigment (indigoidine) exporter [Streptomyces prasinopilosus]